MKKLKIKKVQCMAQVFVLILLFLMQSFYKMEVGAAPRQISPISGEGVAFDGEGNLWMITHDKAATSKTTYGTLGWTIKRYPGAIGGNESVRVKLETYCPDQVDPNNPEYLFGYFMIPKEVIFGKISSLSSEWAESLYKNGGTVYLDGIMTVKERGVRQGSMSENGTLHGEVYTTYEGIAGARPWANKEGLRTHFNKAVSFAGNPGMFEQTTEENVDTIYVSSEIGPGELGRVNQVRISARDFEVVRAIPSSEKVDITGSLQKYYYNGIYQHYHGTATIPVTATVQYTLVWNDGMAHQEKVEVEEQYEVKRDYSYWRIKEMNLYYLNQVRVQNQALPKGEVLFSNCYNPEIRLITNQSDYIQLPETQIKIDGGIIKGGTVKPTVQNRDNFPLIDSNIGQIMVKNDVFSVDGEIWMKGDVKETQTETPVTLTGERKQFIERRQITIPPEILNRVWNSNGTATYIGYGAAAGRTQDTDIQGINAVRVHTPVYCEGIISDDIAFNQQVEPTRYPSLILGRPVTATVGTAGTHILEKGYGAREYRKYVSKRQIMFPFPILFEGKIIEENAWITLKKKDFSFQIPISVEEGDYDIKFRSIAINAENIIKEEENANKDFGNNAAYQLRRVTVVGRLSDFQITNVIDYPRWQKVFWNEDKTERTNIRYFAGINDMNGEPEREADSLFLVPLLKGSHPYKREVHAPGLGYRIGFSLQTIGSMEEEDDSIEMIPEYYYLDANGENRQEVTLYKREGLAPIFIPVFLEKDDREILETGRQKWIGSYQLPPDLYVVNKDINLAEYMEKHNGRIKLSDPVFLKGGYLVVRFHITSKNARKQHLSYENIDNSPKGYCDMWEVEGYQKSRKDGDGTEFRFQEGEVFVFDLKRRMLTDYKSIGTH